MSDSEYIIFCDESDIHGKFFSHFYGGVLVGSSQYDRITSRLNAEKQRLNLHGEVKWSKVTAAYLSKYEELMHTFFEEVRSNHLRVRIMFRHNAQVPIGLTQDQIDGTYFRLYYQFIKHAFGLVRRPAGSPGAELRLYFDEFPQTKEAITQFKGFIMGLNARIQQGGLSIQPQNVAEIRSHDHVLAQCIDIVLGAICFRLNDKHLEKPPGSRRRGKRTIAKDRLYKTILAEIRRIKPNFNVGISTGLPGGLVERWSAPYLHWSFVPSEMEYHKELTKPKKKNGPTQPT